MLRVDCVLFYFLGGEILSKYEYVPFIDRLNDAK